jgi:hypothetical protein
MSARQVAKKRKKKTVKDKLSILAIVSMTVCQKKNRQACNDSNNASGDFFCVKRKLPVFDLGVFLGNMQSKILPGCVPHTRTQQSEIPKKAFV